MRDLSNDVNQPSKKKIGISVLTINIILGSIIVILGMTYLVVVNSISTEGFRIKQMSQQLDTLEQQHKNLELQNSNLQSVSTIQQASVKFDLVPATNVSYLSQDNVALK